MSYMDPGSPTLSTPSSGSPPPDEIPEETQKSSWTSSLAHALSPRASAPGKRRQPPGGGPAGPSSRDTKSRRRDEGAGRKQTGTSGWTEGKQKGDKDELVDIALADSMRKGVLLILEK
jgi:hypothetical protein